MQNNGQDASSTSQTEPQEVDSEVQTEPTGSISAEPEYVLLRVQNPRAFVLPALSGFLLKALESSPLIEDPQAALLELVDYIAHDHAGLFVVRRANDYNGYVAFALAEYSGSALSPACVVLHFYNKGPAEARNLLVDAVVGFARHHGTAKIWGIDVNQQPEAFVKLFEAAGPATPVGQLFEFDLSEGEV